MDRLMHGCKHIDD